MVVVVIGGKCNAVPWCDAVRRCARGRCVLCVLHTVWISCIVCRMHTAGLVYACVMVACLGYSHQQHRIGVACGAAVVCCRSLERVAHSQGDSVSLYVVISHPGLWFTRPSWIVFAQSWFHLTMPNLGRCADSGLQAEVLCRDSMQLLKSQLALYWVQGFAHLV